MCMHMFHLSPTLFSAVATTLSLVFHAGSLDNLALNENKECKEININTGSSTNLHWNKYTQDWILFHCLFYIWLFQKQNKTNKNKTKQNKITKQKTKKFLKRKQYFPLLGMSKWHIPKINPPNQIFIKLFLLFFLGCIGIQSPHFCKWL